LLAYFICSIALADALPPRSVLVLNQSTSSRPWPNAIIAGIRSSMSGNSRGTISFYVEHLDLYQFDSPQYADNLRNYFSDKYRDKPIGVIIAIGPGGLRLAIKLRAFLWPTTPIVFAAVDEDTATHDLPSGVTGAAVEMMLANMMKAARPVVPNLKRFAIVGDRFEDQLYYRHFADEIPDFSRDFEFIDLMGLSISEVRRRVAVLPDDSVIFYIGINSDREATYAAAAEVLPLITEVANRPVIVDVETVFGSGAIGGFILTPDQIGQDAGRLALRILNGEKASDIPITTGSTLKPIFDWRQLQRWHIDERKLSPESEIRFREPNLWEQYRVQGLVVLAMLLVQAALISWLLYEQRRRQRAEVVARNTMSELTQMNRMAAAGELSASIAHEIRQPLTGMVANANAALRWLAAELPNVDKARTALTQIVTAGHHASDIVTSVRAMFKKDEHEEIPVDVNELIETVLNIMRTDLLEHGITLQTLLYERLPAVNGDRVQLQQVIMNLVMNAAESMRSVQPRILRVKSNFRKPNTIHVLVEDTGTGVDPSHQDRLFKALFTTKGRGMGMGLAICRSIIESHNGRIWVSAGLRGGSIFQFELPAAVHETSL
jgi:signal transduction histidine kinase